ncbi:MAG TPA: hypothetical protein VHZ06_00175 [Marmoricola sp.]|nr:hypothetical protein [Marmoricola sp.]
MQDYPVSVAAHVQAKAVDVIPDVVYYWRERDGGIPSLTQRSQELSSLSDRVTSALMVLDIVEAGAPASVPLLHEHLLDIDLPTLVQAGPAAADLATRLGARLGLADVPRWARERLEQRGAASSSREPRASVDDVVWEDGRLVLRVLVEVPGADSTVTLGWDDGSGASADMAAEELFRRSLGPRGTEVELRTVLDPAVLHLPEAPVGLGFRSLNVAVTTDAKSWTGVATGPPHGRGRYVRALPAASNRRVQLQPFLMGRYGVMVHLPRVQADSCEVVGDGLELRGRMFLPEPSNEARLIAVGTTLAIPIAVEADPVPPHVLRFSARVPVAELAVDPDLVAAFSVQQEAGLRLVDGDESRQVTAGAGFRGAHLVVGTRSVGIARNHRGALVTVEQRVSPTLTDIAWTGPSTLRFTGTWGGRQPIPSQVVLRYGKAVDGPVLTAGVRARRGGYVFQLEIASLVRAQPAAGGQHPEEPWHLLLPFADQLATQVFDRDALAGFAKPRVVDGHRVALQCTRNDVVRLAIGH